MSSSPATDLASPLASMDKRNRLARRKPLHRDTSQEEEGTDSLRSSVRSPASMLASPGVLTTSSPLEPGSGHKLTPGVSRIVTPDKEATLKQDASLTPRTRSGGGHRALRSSRTNKANKACESSASMSDDATEDDDDIQPAGMVIHRGRKPKVVKLEPPPSSSVTGWLVASLIVLLAFVVYYNADVVAVTAAGRHMLFTRVDETLIDEASRNMSVARWTEELNSMKDKFPSQDKSLWSILGASVKSILAKSGAKQPAVLLLVADQAGRATAHCLASQIRRASINTLNVSSSSKEFPGNAVVSSDEVATADALFQRLKDELAATATFALKDIQQLRGSTAMALHAFADNIQAPYKKAVIVFVANVARMDLGGSAEAVAEATLVEAWKEDLDEDRYAPLLSRITGSSIRVMPETSIPC